MKSKQLLVENLQKFETRFRELYESHQNLVDFSTFRLVDTRLVELVDFELERSNNDLIIKYNEENLIKNYICNKNYNRDDLIHNFEYFGCHEFGHMLLPEYVIDEVMIQCYREIRTLDFKHFLHGFREFYAELFASQNCSIIPEKYLSIIVNELTLGDPSVINKPSINISKFILNNLFTANKCFVFDRWDLLNTHYRNYNLYEFQNLLHSICFNYQIIIKKFNDYDVMRNKLKDFVKFIERYDLISILRNNTHVNPNIYEINYE